MGVRNSSGFPWGNSELAYSKWVFEIRADCQGGIVNSPIVNGCSKFEQIIKKEIAKSPIVNGCSKFERILEGEKVKSHIVNWCSKFDRILKGEIAKSPIVNWCSK